MLHFACNLVEAFEGFQKIDKSLVILGDTPWQVLPFRYCLALFLGAAQWPRCIG